MTRSRTTVPGERRDKFNTNYVLRHEKTGNHYAVFCSPASGMRLEKTNEPAYVYFAVVPRDTGGFERSAGDRHLWVRCRAEMEDGRFVDTGFDFEFDL